MEIEEIHEHVDSAIEARRALFGSLDREFSVTPGARDVLVQVVANIERDPSESWPEYDADALQRYAVSLLPAVLEHLTYPRHGRRNQQLLSSWEIWHGLSRVLDLMCPLSKDI